MSGSLVISLDFELMWGVRDHRSVAEYGDAVLGGRAAIPAMLERFAARGIRATWATVGLLFARSRDEMLDHAPTLRPAYADPRLSPYPFLERGLGASEADDPLHFGRSLLERVAETPGQEIATHTYSHFYCLEPGATPEALAADLAAARAIAAATGMPAPRSIVFPRNQLGPAHVACAVAHGIDAVRGNPRARLYRARAGAATTLPLRALRLADGALPLVRGLDAPAPARGPDGAVDVAASRFLRPATPGIAGTALYGRAHLARIRAEMTRAARRGTCYHLWWHPHNFGRHMAANLARLDALLDTFAALRDDHGMQSRSMADLAAAAAAVPAAPPV